MSKQKLEIKLTPLGEFVRDVAYVAAGAVAIYGFIFTVALAGVAF